MKKNKIRLLISTLLLFILAAPSYSESVYILCYHAFLEKKDPYSFSNDQFRSQLRRLKDNGFNFVSFEDVINNRISGNRNILVTIDDGNHSVYQTYYSVMKPLGIKPVLAIYPAVISRMHYAMTWNQVKELSDDGCYIASHGYYHLFLSEKFYKKSPFDFKKEIYTSKKVLEEKLNRKIETMVYPFGLNCDAAVSESKNAGYKYGMTVVPNVTSLPLDDNFHINRYLMTKPRQKEFITYMIKNSENGAVAETKISPENLNTAQAVDEKSSNMNKNSVITYPERIKKIIADNLAMMPVITETDNKKEAMIKSTVHPAKKHALKNIKHKKIVTKNETRSRAKKRHHKNSIKVVSI